ncbi:MAG: hypothetical protein PHD48_05515 [Alphaproteobacteria bacterium]|nr:hypothetical protein [Alphaproteobacteria bacterium]
MHFIIRYFLSSDRIYPPTRASTGKGQREATAPAGLTDRSVRLSVEMDQRQAQALKRQQQASGNRVKDEFATSSKHK